MLTVEAGHNLASYLRLRLDRLVVRAQCYPLGSICVVREGRSEAARPLP